MDGGIGFFEDEPLTIEEDSFLLLAEWERFPTPVVPDPLISLEMAYEEGFGMGDVEDNHSNFDVSNGQYDPFQRYLEEYGEEQGTEMFLRELHD